MKLLMDDSACDCVYICVLCKGSFEGHFITARKLAEDNQTVLVNTF